MLALYALSVSLLSGAIAAGLWAWSSLKTPPQFSRIREFAEDATGMTPISKYMRDVARINAWAAACTGISVLAGSAYNLLTLNLPVGG